MNIKELEDEAVDQLSVSGNEICQLSKFFNRELIKGIVNSNKTTLLYLLYDGLDSRFLREKIKSRLPTSINYLVNLAISEARIQSRDSGPLLLKRKLFAFAKKAINF